ncbi:glycosyltransferase [Patescibacteria group bacterium]|nr:glycosyltransferase [Patescibacteria group bacterium]
MRILVVTQALDTDHPVLGFFHRWVEELAPRVSSLHVIALSVGTHAVPENVTVHSLGKETGVQPSFIYAWRFLSRAWALRHEYDVVFVHMNQEYVFLAGLMWKMLGKRVYLWRNHYAGSLLTDVASIWCEKVFYTSRSSYTARYAHAVRMPVGVEVVTTPQSISRKKQSVLWLGRISPAKRPELFVSALKILKERGVAYTATVVGSPLPKDQRYYESLVSEASALGGSVSFLPEVRHADTHALFSAHEYFVNTSPSGMFDKTIFEAAASDTIPLAVSNDWRELVDDERLSFGADARELANRLEALSSLSESERQDLVSSLPTKVVTPHRIETLMDRLLKEMQNT